MIVERVKSFFDWFEVDPKRRHTLEVLAQEAALLSEGMTHLNDYLALAAILETAKPKQIFEIGTYKGITSDFFLQVLPDCKVISIALVNSKRGFFKKRFNNSELSASEVGSYVAPSRRDRFLQILGNSHDLVGKDMVEKFGRMDLVFIDGDHSVNGVKQDTALTHEMIHEKSTICWHDANPKEKYFPVRQYLEKDLESQAIATYDNYIGGIACWNNYTEERLKNISHA